MNLHHIYYEFRKRHGIIDSIRFTARELALSPLDVAQKLRMVEYYMEHRS